MVQKMTDPMDSQIGQNEEKTISMTGKASVKTETTIETVPGPGFESVAELEKFMQEPIEVFLYEPHEEGQEYVVQLAVNGINQFTIRGRSQIIKRKYVEVLARSRRVNVTAHGYKDGMGEAKNTVNVSSGLQYPFQVVSDPNPKGPAWLKQILAEV